MVLLSVIDCFFEFYKIVACFCLQAMLVAPALNPKRYALCPARSFQY